MFLTGIRAPGSVRFRCRIGLLPDATLYGSIYAEVPGARVAGGSGACVSALELASASWGDCVAPPGSCAVFLGALRFPGSSP